jgi:hypothetical protein
MSGQLNQYIKDKEYVFEAVKAQAKLKIERGELTGEALQTLLEKSFILGRFMGHCQAELHRRRLYKTVDDYED